jgi:molecular chaperone HscC
MLVGIDLGTTNSAIAYWKDTAPVLIPNALGDLLTPSAVSLTDKGELLIGMAARERQTTHPQLSATTFKRLMGTNEKIRLGKKIYSPEELSSLVLANLKRDAEHFLGEEVTGAIITVPAYFNDRQRRATQTAGELAGLKVERLINEPTAAALAHGIHQLEYEEPFLIFDLGGGTFDVSLVEMFDGIIEVRSSAGDNQLGGEDFNELVAQMAKNKIPEWQDLAKKRPAEFRELMRSTAERTRRKLSNDETVDALFEFGWDGKNYSIPMAPGDFEIEAKPLLDRLREPVRRSLNDTNMRADAVGKIILVGGSTRMPIVRRAVTRMFGRFPDTTLDPDQSIALGAAVQAGLMANNAALDEVRLTDVCPFTLGIEVGKKDENGRIEAGFFSPLIERNTVIPASRVETYQPFAKGQRQSTISIYQGESRLVASNILLGNLEINHSPNLTPEQAAYDVRFSYDVSGILEVDVTIKETGVTKQLLIRNGDDNISEEDIEKRRAELAKLKIHPRDDAVNAALLARMDRIFEGSIGGERDIVGDWISRYMMILNRQDPKEIQQFNVEVELFLQEYDGDRIL